MAQKKKEKKKRKPLSAAHKAALRKAMKARMKAGWKPFTKGSTKSSPGASRKPSRKGKKVRSRTRKASFFGEMYTGEDSTSTPMSETKTATPGYTPYPRLLSVNKNTSSGRTLVTPEEWETQFGALLYVEPFDYSVERSSDGKFGNRTVR